MLSAETASGKYPAETVNAMSQICLNAEGRTDFPLSPSAIPCFDHVDEAIAMATMYTANHLAVRAIASLTESGSTALWMSRHQLRHSDLCAFAPEIYAAQGQSLSRCFSGSRFPTMHVNHAEANLACG